MIKKSKRPVIGAKEYPGGWLFLISYILKNFVNIEREHE